MWTQGPTEEATAATREMTTGTMAEDKARTGKKAKPRGCDGLQGVSRGLWGMAPGLRAPFTQTRWQAEEAALGEDRVTAACTC